MRGIKLILNNFRTTSRMMECLFIYCVVYSETERNSFLSNTVEIKKTIRSSATLRARLIFGLICENVAQNHNKLHQSLHNIYKKLQLWLLQREIKNNNIIKKLSGKTLRSRWLLLFIYC